MHCAKCGAALADGSSFCQLCGGQAESPAVSAKKGRSWPGRDLAGGIIGGLLGWGLIVLSRDKIAEMQLPEPGAGSTRRVDETSMMNMLSIVGWVLVVAGIFYIVKAALALGRPSD